MVVPRQERIEFIEQLLLVTAPANVPSKKRAIPSAVVQPSPACFFHAWIDGEEERIVS